MYVMTPFSILKLTLTLCLGSVISHTAPNAQMFKKFSGHATVLLIGIILASSIMTIFKGESRDKIYPLSQSPSSLCPHINTPTPGLKITNLVRGDIKSLMYRQPYAYSYLPMV